MELFGYDICFLNGFLKKLILRKKETKVGVETGRERQRERKTLTYCSTYVCTHWLILLCP